jgi:hypothetical protein
MIYDDVPCFHLGDSTVHMYIHEQAVGFDCSRGKQRASGDLYVFPRRIRSRGLMFMFSNKN